jgi:hypothetical protein
MPKAQKKSKPAAKRPTSARLLKHRPADPPEPPEAADQEQLETPDNPKPKRGRPRQARLPEMEDPEIEELESAAEEYASIRDERMALTEKEVPLKAELIELMHKHNKTSYVHAGVDVKLIVESEKVRVRIKKDKGD